MYKHINIGECIRAGDLFIGGSFLNLEYQFCIFWPMLKPWLYIYPKQREELFLARKLSLYLHEQCHLRSFMSRCTDRNRIKTHVKLQQQFLPILNFVLCDSLWLLVLTRTQFLMNLTQISQVSYIKLNTGFKQQITDLWTPKGTIFLQFPSTIVQKIRN
jgi:hypothetical protein